MTTRLPIFTILILAVAVALYFFGGRRDQSATSLAPSGAASGAHQGEASQSLPKAQTSNSAPSGHESNSNVQALSAKLTPESEVDGDGESTHSEPESDEREVAWLRRYGNWDVTRLRTELALLERQFDSQRTLAFDDLYILDQHKSYGPGEELAPVGMSSFGTPLLTDMRTQTNLTTLQPSVALLILSEDTHGALYALQAEIAWLHARIDG